jgi:hypothetical protein
VDDAVLFPFGMGAFLRHLGKNDDRYIDDDKMRDLRRRVADQVMEAICAVDKEPLKDDAAVSNRGAAFPKRVHFCLACAGIEGVENHNAFVEAAGAKSKEYPRLKSLLKFRQNVCALQLSQELAVSAGNPLKVAMLNGANRKLIGNHWFQSGARLAIDENIHRRSVSMSRVSLLLNMGTEPSERRVNELRGNLQWFGGHVVMPMSAGAQSSVPAVADKATDKATDKANDKATDKAATHEAVDKAADKAAAKAAEKERKAAEKAAAKKAAQEAKAKGKATGGSTSPCSCCVRRNPNASKPNDVASVPAPVRDLEAPDRSPS